MYSDDIIQKVRELYTIHNNYRKVSSLINIPESTVRYMVNNDYTKKKKKSGRKNLITRRDEVKIKREVRNLNSRGERASARKILQNLNLHVSLRSVHRILNKLNFKYESAKKEIKLTKIHKKKRTELSEKWIADAHSWTNTVFTDEKKLISMAPILGPHGWIMTEKS